MTTCLASPMVHRPELEDVAGMVGIFIKIQMPMPNPPGKWMYTHTVRKEVAGEMVETRTNVSRQIYDQLLAQVEKYILVFCLKLCYIVVQSWRKQDLKLAWSGNQGPMSGHHLHLIFDILGGQRQ